MDKSKFFKGYAPDTCDFKMPDGQTVILHGLTVAQRGKMAAVVSDDATKGQALVVCMSAEILSEGDVGKVLQMDGQLVADIADQVMRLSGLGGDEKN